ncbi:ABC transporter substrate-binding protein [Methylobrevis pamukkalensis]|uniref:Putative thiamine biosynthesis protein n=1 Tax=Methylobrevis pamukkalensis TaxID=1439726 RepID=A0A1E3H668_9HYPH|nr:ABC transporter substrate-binding protein [Methylobrevis pamukkalensis]ODN71817.1 putative thiamine biosynthesis protein [Methylobrevis pamukkalensis]
MTLDRRSSASSFFRPSRRMATFGLAAGLAAAALGLGAPFAATPASAATKVTFVQEWPVADGFWIPWILGKEKGFYAEEGIDLEIIAPPTVADTMKFLGTASADVAFTTVMDVIFAKEQEAPVIAIGRYGRSNNWGLLSKAGKPVDLAGLKGKSVGIYNDAWSMAQLSIMLKSVGLAPTDLTLVTAADDTVPLLLQDRVDAITGITNAEGTGIQVAGEQKAEFLPAIDHGVPNTPIFMLAANTDWLAANPELARGFLRATQKSIVYAIANPDEGTAAFAAAYAKAYDPKFISTQWADTIPLFGTPGADLMVMSDADWSALLAAVGELGIVKAVPEATSLYTNDYLPK